MTLSIPRYIKNRFSFKTLGRSQSTPTTNQFETKFELEPDDIEENEDNNEENIEKVKDANEIAKQDSGTLRLKYATQLMYTNMSNKRNFWDIDGYKTVVNRIEDGYELGLKLKDMLSDRADIEKEYANKLKKWKEKWENILKDKGSYEHPITSYTWYSLLETGDATAKLHEKLCENVIKVPVYHLAKWLDEKYKVNRINFKVKKSFDEKFTKAQESWKKNMSLLEDAKKNYYTACKKVIKEEKTERNIKLNPKSTENDKTKAEKEFDKRESQRDKAKELYETKLNELKTLQKHYQENMKKVYHEAEQFEEARLIEFGKFLSEFNQILSDHYTKPSTYENMIKRFSDSLSRVDYAKDLDIFSTHCGLKMEHNLPIFEEFSE